jgi:hypothetical protein
VPIVLKSVSLNLLEPSGPVKACKGIALLLYLLHTEIILSGKTIKENVSKGKRVRVIPQTQYSAVSIKIAKQVSRNRKD